MEGQVVEMGLTTTSLLTAEKFPVIVPNSLFSSQVSFLNCSFFDETTEISLRHPADAKLQKEGNCQLSKYNKAKELMSSSYSSSFFGEVITFGRLFTLDLYPVLTCMVVSCYT